MSLFSPLVTITGIRPLCIAAFCTSLLSTPIKAEPIRSEPIRSEPIRSEPLVAQKHLVDRAWVKKHYPRIFEPKGVHNPPFYIIEKDGKKSYLLGTLHFGISLGEFPSEVAQRFVEAKYFYSEIDLDLDDPGYTQRVTSDPTKYSIEFLQRKIFDNLKNGKSFIGLNDKVLRQLLYLGMPAPVAALLPNDTELSLEFTLPNLMFPNYVSLDTQLQMLSRHIGRAVLTLEDEKIRDEANKLSDNDKFYLETAIENESLLKQIYSYFEEMITNYRAGAIDDDRADCNSDEPDMSYRNRIWVKKLELELKKGDHFIAVGAGHLCGQNGLVSLLRKAGFSVTRR